MESKFCVTQLLFYCNDRYMLLAKYYENVCCKQDCSVATPIADNRLTTAMTLIITFLFIHSHVRCASM